MKKRFALFVASMLLAVCALAADLRIVWDDPNPPEQQVTGYTVYERFGDAAPYTYSKILDVATLPTEAAPAVLTGVVPGRHVYVVTARNLWGDSPYSEPGRTPPAGTAAPMNISITVVITVTVPPQ